MAFLIDKDNKPVANPESVARRRKVAEAYMAAGQGAEPIQHWTQGAAKLANALVGGWGMKQAEQQESEGRKAATDAITAALSGMGPGGSGADFGELVTLAQDPWLNQGQSGIVSALLERQLNPPERWEFAEINGMPGQRSSVSGKFDPFPAANTPDPFTLSAGQTRYGPDGQVIASVPVEAPAPDPFTLGPGQARFDADGNPIASLPPADQRPWWVRPDGTVDPAYIRGQEAGADNITVGGGKYGTIPQGYELVEGPEGAFLRPIPGGPAQAEIDAANAKADEAASQAAVYADVVTQDIDRAISLIETAGFPVTGLGALTSAIPGTPAHDVSRLIDTIKANVGFDRLQQMRANSPTGGALGPVSDFENQLLQATIGNLALSQSQDQLLFNLRRVKDIYAKIVNEGIKPGDPILSPDVQASPEPPDQSGTPQIPTVGTVIDGYRYKGGNPADPSSWERTQ